MCPIWGRRKVHGILPYKRQRFLALLQPCAKGLQHSTARTQIELEVRQSAKFAEEQQAILERPPTKTIKILAGAGCGKASTLEAYGRRWQGRGLYLALNSSIA